MAQGAQGNKAVPTRVRARYDALWEYTEKEATFTMKDGSVISGTIRYDNKTSATLAWELPSSLEEALAAFGKSWSTMDGSTNDIDFDDLDPSWSSDNKACTYYDENDQVIDEDAVEDVEDDDCEDVLGYESTYGPSCIQIDYSDGQSVEFDKGKFGEDWLARLREALTREASQG